jgi:hypothetical protein
MPAAFFSFCWVDVISMDYRAQRVDACCQRSPREAWSRRAWPRAVPLGFGQQWEHLTGKAISCGSWAVPLTACASQSAGVSGTASGTPDGTSAKTLYYGIIQQADGKHLKDAVDTQERAGQPDIVVELLPLAPVGRHAVGARRRRCLRP